ncbi:MAG: hypothetical protein JJE03_07720 [Peptostreptococcaceae bacterium]|nr:hypothetical protein [Peptostreptococcaceae bacterium]
MKLYELITKTDKDTFVQVNAGPIIYATMPKDSKYIPVGILNGEVKSIKPAGTILTIEVEDDERA